MLTKTFNLQDLPLDLEFKMFQQIESFLMTASHGQAKHQKPFKKEEIQN